MICVVFLQGFIDIFVVEAHPFQLCNDRILVVKVVTEEPFLLLFGQIVDRLVRIKLLVLLVLLFPQFFLFFLLPSFLLFGHILILLN